MQGSQLVGQCITQQLAAARVCPAPVENSIVTIGLDTRDDQQTRWHADLWKLSKRDEVEIGLEKVMSFQGGADADKDHMSSLGNDFRLGSLCASELAISNQGRDSTCDEIDQPCLLLCNLTDSGYITTHSISEAIEPDLVMKSEWRGSSLKGGMTATQMRFPPSEHEHPIKDAARDWGKQREVPNPVQVDTRPTNRDELPTAPDGEVVGKNGSDATRRCAGLDW